MNARFLFGVPLVELVVEGKMVEASESELPLVGMELLFEARTVLDPLKSVITITKST